MNQRRRFFPSNRVQRTEAKSVELEMQLQPAPEASDSVLSETFGAGWLLSMLRGDSSVEQLEPGRVLVYGSTNGIARRAIYEGEFEIVENGFLLAKEGPTFRCTELELDSGYWGDADVVGVLQAQTLIDPHWELEWNSPSDDDSSKSTRGHTAITRGNMLWMRFADVEGSSGPSETMLARAFCGGEEVAQLRLTINYPGT